MVEAYRIIASIKEGEEEPRFISLPNRGDHDKVIRLATKLDDTERGGKTRVTRWPLLHVDVFLFLAPPS
jgi:hypothetical protein